MTICQTDMILPCRRVKRPFALGLTGSIGMGKSAVAAMLEEAGVKVFDADRAVHILQAPGGALVDVIERHFPGTTDEGGVNRAKLGAIVLGDKDKLRQLERIIHPEVARMRREFSLAHRARKAIAYDIPLLFEKTGKKGLDGVLVVNAAPWQQRQRCMARPGMTAKKLAHIRRLQVPGHIKAQKADWVINTGVQKWQTRAQVRIFVQKLFAALA